MGQEFIIEITVLHSEPKIWRRMSVETTLSFDMLHMLTQAAFSMAGIDDYEFTASDKATGRCLYRLFSEEEEDEIGDKYGERNSSQVGLTDYFPKKKKIYYKSGMWDFCIELKEVKTVEYPLNELLEGEGLILFEDFGGVYGQMAIREALEKHADEPIADYVRKMLGLRKNAKVDFDLAQAHFYEEAKAVDRLSYLMRAVMEHLEELDALDDNEFDDELDDDFTDDFDDADQLRALCHLRHGKGDKLLN